MEIDLDVSPDVLVAMREQWEEEWRVSGRGITNPDGFEGERMSRNAIRERVNRLESEFERISAAAADTQTPKHKKDFESRASMRIISELIEECRPISMNILSTVQADSSAFDYTQVIADLHHIDRMYDFVLFCYNKAVTLGWGVNAGGLTLDNQSETDGPDSDLEPGTPIAAGVQLQPNAFRSEDVGLGRMYGRRPNQLQPFAPMTVASSSQSHQQSLTTLIAIAFFGASITWSTIFSGTRGNLLLITWSASLRLFIVGTVVAFAATLLVLPEEDLITKYPPVRWTVRLLSLVAMVHVVAGMLCVALAIFLLDPGSREFQGTTNPVWFRMAGGYAMGMASLSLTVAGLIWRRYATPTWFKLRSSLGRAYDRERKD